MQKPKIPANEAERLQTLAGLNILDTPPEERFDAITRFVARALNTQSALISFIDDEQQWFKSRVGVDGETAPRDISFCAHVVGEGGAILVDDAREDVRFAGNPMVEADPPVRFYAGFPLTMDDGHVVGTLCAFDPTPRTLSDEHADLMRMLSTQVVHLLELHRASQRLEEQRQQTEDHRRFFDLSVELLCTAGHDMHFQMLSPSWETVMGYSREELRAQPYTAFIDPDDQDITATEAKHLEDGGESVNFENTYLTKDGKKVRLSWSSRATPDKVFAVARDVTAQREQEALLRESEQTLRAVFEGMSEGVVMQAQGGAIIANNEAAEQVLGLTADQLRGRTSVDERWRAVREDGSDFPGQDHPAMVSLGTGKRVIGVVMGVHKPDGDLTWLNINSVPLFRDDEEAPYAVVSTFRDVTEERKQDEIRERLASQERLITTGTLAAGVGHEINNPLSYITSNAVLALEEIRDISGGSPSGRLRNLEEMVLDINDGADRIRRIVLGLKGLAREDGTIGPTSVNDTLELAVHMATHEIRQRATLISELDDTPAVLADSSKLGQVFVNLLVNAAQAFTDSDPGRNVIRLRTFHQDNEVHITVGDNGPGIDDDTLPRIFDPFFTTKPVGVGTGLGLSITHTILTNMGGRVEVHTELGKGTTFDVVLPAGAVTADDGAANRRSSAVRGRVLIVDDDEAVLRTLKRILQRHYGVTALSDPRIALTEFEGGQRFDAVLCDLMMPHLGGADLYQRVVEIDPEQARRFVFLTGGAYDTTNASFLDVVENEVLTKPYKVDQLRDLIADMVAQPFGAG